MMRIVFFGSDDFAAVHLKRLLEAGYLVVACVTGPDQPQGRGMRIVFSPIKEIAIAQQIPCLQPESLKTKNIVEELKNFDADIFVVVAYGRLLTQEILNIPKKLCLNVHGSLLPKYRGAAPVHWAVLNGDKQTGVTIQKMALALDAGDIVASTQMAILNNEDADELRQRMAVIGADLLVRTLNENPKGKFLLTPQDEAHVTYAPKLTRAMSYIDWQKPASVIINQVRGLKPWPLAQTMFNGKILKILKLELSNIDKGHSKEGQVIGTTKEGFLVACVDKPVLVREVQPEAGKRMLASSFASGYKISIGSQFNI